MKNTNTQVFNFGKESSHKGWKDGGKKKKQNKNNVHIFLTLRKHIAYDVSQRRTDDAQGDGTFLF